MMCKDAENLCAALHRLSLVIISCRWSTQYAMMVKNMSQRRSFGTSVLPHLRDQSGQVAVIVFLIMAVLLVVGLSLASRTSQEIELAGQQEDTTRVFNAAETGIEQALSDSSNFTITSEQTEVINPQSLQDTQTSGSVTITPQTGFENEYEPGETATVFTTGENRDLVIRWHPLPASCDNAAVLAITTYVEVASNTYTAKHYGVRPGGCSGTGTGFEASEATGAGGYAYSYTISDMTDVKMVRIKPLRAGTALQVSSSALSPQVYNIRSEARDISSGSTEVRAIEVTRTKPAPPSIFDYALYSGGDLTKN